MRGLDRTQHHGQRDADRPAKQATTQQTDRDEPVPPSEIPYGYHDVLLDPEWSSDALRLQQERCQAEESENRRSKQADLNGVRKSVRS